MLQPPQHLIGSEFASKTDLVHAIKQHAAEEGYAVVTRDSKAPRADGTPGKVDMICDRGLLATSKAKVRETSSRRCNCPFRLVLRCEAGGAALRWFLDINNPDHNHEGSEHRAAHPTLRRAAFTPTLRNSVWQMSTSGSRARTILSTLRQEHPELSITKRDVLNNISKMRHESLHGLPRMEAMREELRAEGWTSNVTYDDEGRIERLFIADPALVEMLRTFPEVRLCSLSSNSLPLTVK